MREPVSEDINRLILKELQRIYKILTLVHGKYIEEELEKIANTNKRKVMWVLMDGEKMTKDIANILGVSEMAVSKFLKKLSIAGFATNPKGKPPKRMIDYVPPSWIDLLEKFQGNDRNK